MEFKKTDRQQKKKNIYIYIYIRDSGIKSNGARGSPEPCGSANGDGAGDGAGGGSSANGDGLSFFFSNAALLTTVAVNKPMEMVAQEKQYVALPSMALVVHQSQHVALPIDAELLQEA